MASEATQDAFVLYAVDGVRIEKRPRLDPSQLAPLESVYNQRDDGQTGICGSDVSQSALQTDYVGFFEHGLEQVHYLKHMRIGDFVVEKPMVLGHESAGVVIHVGSEVKSVKVGDRVALEPGASCRSCHFCKDGFYEHCDEMKFAATPPHDGSLCAEYLIPSDLCFKLPNHVSLEQGAMIEPLSVAVQALTKIGRLKPNQNVCIFGSGPVGLLTMAAAKALGAKRIVAVDIIQHRLDFARQYAATDIFLPTRTNEGESEMDYAKRESKRLLNELGLNLSMSNGLDLVLDASGASSCVQIGMLACRTRGTFVQIGMGSPNVEIPLTNVLTKALTVKGSFRYGAGVYALAIDLVAQGKITLAPLITHRYAFNEAKKAFEAAANGKGDDGKPIIKVLISGPE